MVTARQAKPARMPGSAASKASVAPRSEKAAPQGLEVRPRRAAGRAPASRPHRERDAPPTSWRKARLLAPESLLSKLENNRANPSISMPHRLASALGTNLARLVASESSDDHAVVFAARRIGPPSTRRPRVAMEGSRFRALGSRRGQGHLPQGQIHILEPGARSDGAVSLMKAEEPRPGARKERST